MRGGLHLARRDLGGGVAQGAGGPAPPFKPAPRAAKREPSASILSAAGAAQPRARLSARLRRGLAAHPNARHFTVDRIVKALGATALSAVFVGVEYAILIGAAASITWYLLHASRLKTLELIVAPEHVVRARIPADPPAKDIAIYDFEGEFFFGAAPEIQQFLQRAKDEALANGTKALVLRLKRVRNPDAVALEVLDVFLKEAQRDGVVVFLAGLRPELEGALERMGVAERLGKDLIFPEQEKDYSATLSAIRAAYARIEKERAPAANYYLV